MASILSSAPTVVHSTPENSSTGWPSFWERFTKSQERTQDGIKLGGKVNMNRLVLPPRWKASQQSAVSLRQT
jgi:peptide methionine sulfoxide reductase MsrB